jgi:polysaccharide deacetylase 2 family uncharacterized protein YibQ
MARGFLSGAIWGTVLSLGGLGAVSVLTPGPDDMSQPMSQKMPDVMPTEDAATAEPETPEMPVGEDQSTTDSDVATDSDTTVPAPVAETEPETAGGQDQPAEPVVDSTSEEQPETGAAAETEANQPVVAETVEMDSLTGPMPADAPEVPASRPADVAAVAPETNAPGLATPETSPEPLPEATTATPGPTPTAGDEIAALADPQTPEVSQPQVAVTGDVAPESGTAPTLDAPESETGLNVSTEPAQPPAPVEPPVTPESGGEPEAPATEPASSDADTASDIDAGDANASAEERAGVERPQVRRLVPSTPETTPDGSTDTTAALRPSIGRPAASLTDRNPGNSVRLPSIGSQDSDTGASAGEAAAEASVDPSAPPLQRYAVSVESDPALPRMSIVMIDDGTGPLGPDTLEGFPFPVTFALDPGQPGAADRMKAYRALGYEVAVLVDLPAAAQPTDVEQILGGAVAAVPEAVALIEAEGAGLQSGRAVTEQTAQFAAESGHGLVFLPNGLNTAQAIAQRENVPSVSILRDFDGDGQDARTKRRFLDGAAFRARQDGSVVMLGRLTPDTLSALVLWGLQDRASSVAMVPVSSILLEQSN